MGLQYQVHWEDLVCNFKRRYWLAPGVVVKGEASDETFLLEHELNQEDSIIINGTVRKEPRSVGGYELGVKEIKVVNHVTEEFPISPKEHGADFLMSNRHLWLRSKRQNSIMRIRHQIVKAIRDFFDDNGFTLLIRLFSPLMPLRVQRLYLR